MKRWMIWTICMLMGLSFVALLYLQMRYARSMIRMRQQQFDESVFRSLDRASMDLERNETMVYLEDMVSQYGDTLDRYNPSSPLVKDVTQTGMHEFQKRIRNAYIYEHNLLDKVVLRVLYAASDKSFNQRLDPAFLKKCISRNLKHDGIDLPFCFKVYTSEGVEIYRSKGYDPKGEEYSYTQTLFRNDPTGSMGVVSVHFPDQSKYIFKVADSVMVAILFTLILFITFIITVYLVVRQRKVAEMKNDFINNMTHEFKTPISTISIAAQMLSDKSIQKPVEMYERLSGVIYAETKRLRFQVEKVLQMSLYEGGNMALKMVTMDANALIDSVVQTFSVKVSQMGGSIDTRLDAQEADVSVDEMHFTNIIFNLMDNAVKYRREEEPLHLVISTWNRDDHLFVQVRDNGIGIRKDDLKRIFEKFYRVHTGNKHNVKGFGLGLAYVHKMVELQHGTIRVSSEYGKGTRFTIAIPVVKD